MAKQRRKQKAKQLQGLVGKKGKISSGQIEKLFQEAEELFNAGNKSESERIFRAIINVKPDHYPSLIQLTRMAMETGHLADALEFAQDAVEAFHAGPTGHQLLASVFSKWGLMDMAESEYTIALQLDNQNPAIINSLGNVYSAQGRFDEAIDAYHQAIALNPNDAFPYYNLVRNKRFSKGDKDIEKVEKLRDGMSSRSVADQVHIHFALGKIYHDCGNYDEAFEEFRKGNQLKSGQTNFDIDIQKKFIDRIIHTQTKSWWENNSGKGFQNENNEGGSIFIIGMPRSGTTLLESLLCRHHQISGIGELPHIEDLAISCRYRSRVENNFPEVLNELTASDYNELGESYVELSRQFGISTTHTVNKTVNNFLYLGFILAILPNAKLLHSHRDPVDTCLSIYQQHFAGGQSYAYDLKSIGQYYLLYKRIMDHWKCLFPDRILKVDYEEVVSDTENQLRRVISFCELPWDESCLDQEQKQHVSHTASAWQARQPVYRSSVRRWKRYEKHLGPLLEVLEPISGNNN